MNGRNMITINEKLHQLIIWSNSKCKLCGRKYPETIINIEGHIYHGCDLICLDKKSCMKQIKKNKRSKGNV